jgi:hypothetical protein
LLALVCIQATHDLLHLARNRHPDLNPGEVRNFTSRLARTSPQLLDDRGREDDISYLEERFDVPQTVEGDRNAGVEGQDGTGRGCGQATPPEP